MLTVDISKRPPFASSTPRLIFEGSYSRSSVYVANYDVMEDGLWFLMIQGDDQQTTPMEFRLMLDWAEKLKPRRTGFGRPGCCLTVVSTPASSTFRESTGYRCALFRVLRECPVGDDPSR